MSFLPYAKIHGMSSYKLNVFLALMEIVEHGFIFKLKQRQPDITEEEIQKRVTSWYLERSAEEEFNPDCEPIDLKKYQQ
jgi:hypothetical protein